VNIDIGIVTVRTFCLFLSLGVWAKPLVNTNVPMKMTANSIDLALNMYALEGSRDNNIDAGYYEIYDAKGLNWVSAAVKVNLFE
jgi:hypothetical protein